jgi:hypothetical protein
LLLLTIKNGLDHRPAAHRYEKRETLVCKLVPFKCDHWVDQDHLRDSGKAAGKGVGKIIANIW